MDDVMKNLNIKLKQYRKMYGYTQAKVAESIGIDTKYYNSVENGHRNLDISKLIRLCNLYKITLNDMLDLSDDTGKEKLRDEWICEINEALKKMTIEDIGRIKSVLKYWNE